ncbi:hypothetical protein SpCBS45565_g02672 [Spizellomyces sp. 'palustris']|nr:hypothetical protein SpCBS45565_g02672 [Spizellomyces sp. 'palustris']
MLLNSHHKSPSITKHIDCYLANDNVSPPHSPFPTVYSTRDIELLNYTSLDFIRPEVPRDPPVCKSAKLRQKYLLAQQSPAPPAASEGEGFKFGGAGSSSTAQGGIYVHKNPSTSSLSAGLAAAAAAHRSDSPRPQQQPQQSQQRIGVGAVGMGTPMMDMRGLAIAQTPPPRINNGSPCSANRTTRPLPVDTFCSTMGENRPASPSIPVNIPSSGIFSQGDYARVPASPPSESSSAASSPGAVGAEGSSRTWAQGRQKDRVGMHRPRHSLSVSIVRRRTSSGASSPVTSGSYSSLTQSPAVSFLASLADMSVPKGPVHGVYSEGDQVGDFILGREIGSGAFARVFEADVIDGPHKQLGKVAVKVVKKNQPRMEDGQDVQQHIDHETTIWARLRHPHVLEMLELMDADDAVFVVCELATDGNLLDLIVREGRLSEGHARNLFRQIADALRYLHEEIQVVHRDIKCENILLDTQGNAKIADFGLSVEIAPLSPEASHNVAFPNDPVFCHGSLHYCAPEELRQTTHSNPASDVWSLGCVLYAMLTGTLPFNDGFPPRLQAMIINGRYDTEKLDRAGVSKEAKDLIAGMLKTKIEERLTMCEIWNHPWILRQD